MAPRRRFCLGRQTSLSLLIYILPIYIVSVAVPSWGADSPRIEIHGAPLVVRQNILAQLSLAGEDCALPAWRAQQLQAKLPAEVVSAMQALGWYGGGIEAQDLAYRDDCWRLTLHLTPGRRVTVTRFAFEVEGAGRDDHAFALDRLDLPLALGDTLNHKAYEDSKQAILTLAQRRGYFLASLREHRLLIDPATASAEVLLRLDTGPRYRLGALRMPHSPRLQPDFVRRFIILNEGQPFHDRLLLNQQRDLYDSGYFSRVEVRKRLDLASGEAVPIEIGLKERNRHAYTIGGGYATDTGPRGRLGYSNLFMTRRGHRLQADALISPRRQELEGSYTIPLERPLIEEYRLHVGLQREFTDTARSRTFKWQGSRIDRLPGGWLQTVSIDYQREDFTVARDAQRTYLLMPGIAWEKRYRDQIALPRDAWRLGLRLRGSYEVPISDLTFVQGLFTAKVVRGLPLGLGRLLTRLDAGVTEAEKIERLPATLRFFAGGDTSIRGYTYQGLGPVNGNGQVTGGRYLLVGSGEYELVLGRLVGLALFYDAGKAFDDLHAPWYRGIGGGLRWRSPIGPIRLDLAHPLGGQGVRLHLSMGPDV